MSDFEMPVPAAPPGETADGVGLGGAPAGGEEFDAQVEAVFAGEAPAAERSPFEESERSEEPAPVGGAEWEPYAPVLQRFQELGVTPERVLQTLEELLAPSVSGQRTPPAGEPEPPAAPSFEEFLAERGIDPEAVDGPALTALQLAHEQAGMLRELHQQAEAAREQAQLSEWRAEMEGVQHQFPAFRNPELGQFLLAAWAEAPEGVSMAAVAQRMLGSFEQAFRNQLSLTAAQRGADARRPVTAGGGAPSPAPRFDWATAPDAEFETALESQLRAMLAE